MTDERLKIWLGLLKWTLSTIVVTGGIAWATTIINAKHKDTELQILINREEKVYLTSFLERALDDNLEKRHRFAQFLANVAASRKYKKGWQEYFNTVDAELKAIKKEKEELEKGLKEKQGEELRRAKQRLTLLERQLEVRIERPSSSALVHHGLNSLDVLLNANIVCPSGTHLSLWHEEIFLIGAPDFPPNAKYVTCGCKTDEGNQIGPLVAWYPNGQVIQKGRRGETDEITTTTTWYPNGAKAAEWQSQKGVYIPGTEKIWSPDGKAINP